MSIDDEIYEDVREFSGEACEGVRLDAALASLDSDISRSKAQKLIESGCVLVNGSNKKVNYKVKKDDIIVCNIPRPEAYDVEAENIPIEIIYEDKDVAIINKAKGMVVHPAPGHSSGTLVNAVMYHIKDLSGIGGVQRPGIVHRLDKDTSGLIMIAKNDFAHEALSSQLEDKTMNRRYLAICKGNFKEDYFEVEKPIDRSKKDRKKMAVCHEGEGRYAKTAFYVRGRSGDYTLLECKLFTGRTHQIRVHLAHIGHPIVGDETYGKKGKINFDGQALHGFRLEFIHPGSRETVVYVAQPPEDFLSLAKRLGLYEDVLNCYKIADNQEILWKMQ